MDTYILLVYSSLVPHVKIEVFIPLKPTMSFPHIHALIYLFINLLIQQIFTEYLQYAR